MSGDSLGYWHFFPTPKEHAQDWGKVTVWGMADIVESNCPELTTGRERIYGFFPPWPAMLCCNQARLSRMGLPIPPPIARPCQRFITNIIAARASHEHYRQIENERCLYFPLFITSFVLSDFLQDQSFFNARQIIIGSASSKPPLVSPIS